MLNFDEERYLRIQTGAVALAPALDDAVGTALGKGARNIFFLGTGGAAILMQPAVQVLMRQSTFPVFSEISTELVLDGHVSLGPQSIVVIPSLSGTTKESIAALDYCKALGATVLSLVGHADTPLAKAAGRAFVNFAEDDTSCESFMLQALAIALSLMSYWDKNPINRTRSELERLPPLLLGLKKAFEPEAERLAAAFETEPYHILTGAGGTWPMAWYYGMCILEEMQWIRTRPVHASDFFHGTLELVEKGVSVIVLKGEDASRPLAERVEAFARSQTEKVTVLDSKSFALPGITSEARGLLSPIVLAAALERLSTHLAVKRNHPLTTRRYYKRMAY